MWHVLAPTAQLYPGYAPTKMHFEGERLMLVLACWLAAVPACPCCPRTAVTPPASRMPS